jgi:hypothetical protein
MEGRVLMRLGVRLENDGGCKRGCTPPPICPFSNLARVSRKNDGSVEVYMIIIPEPQGALRVHYS